MTSPALREQSTAWDLRKAWATCQHVRLTLAAACMIRTVVGQVEHVAVTGAFVTVDGWHIPTVMIEGIGKPTREDREKYRRVMRSAAMRQALEPEAA